MTSQTPDRSKDGSVVLVYFFVILFIGGWSLYEVLKGLSNGNLLP